MGGSPRWKQLQQTPVSADTLAAKKRKREDVDGRNDENVPCRRYMTRRHIPGKELFPLSTKAAGSQPSVELSSNHSPRCRLQSIPTKRPRVEQAWEDHCPSPPLCPTAEQESNGYHNSPAIGSHQPSWNGAQYTKKAPPLTSPTSLKPRAPIKQQQKHQDPHNRQPAQQHRVYASDNYGNTATAFSLRPCRVCHRKPTTRSAIDSYADCGLCGERTCYICLRECLSPYCCALVQPPTRTSGDAGTAASQPCGEEPVDIIGRRICSACAVEGVTEYGEDIVWCLDCVEKDGEMETGES